jgi:transposase-like protein
LAYVWFDATCVKIRLGGPIVSVAVSIAIGVSPDGRCNLHGPECRIWPDFAD